MSVWQKQKNWWNEVLWKPKKALSLDQLKFQHHMLLKNPVVTEHNKQLLVETFRSIAEILIWGDQNDSRVFDFFLEKNMQSFFMKILNQKCGHYVCVQLLQTLNILFENIRNETSIYYLLSNNHINSIIVLKLDFSDEEVLAYYISFLKTLSFHLNKHTIHFFCNEHLRDFPLYTEAIKFFKHSENMVRIAVRTLTLNVYKVDDKATRDYICNKTAAPYFSNLAWFIGNHVIELDECLISQAHHLNRGRLEQLVAEHLDHLHYISDIFALEVQCLNNILSDHFLNRLLIPLYIYSLIDEANVDSDQERNPRISSKVALFLLSQVFLILSHSSLVMPLAYLIFTGDTSLTLPPVLQGHKRGNSYNSVCAFVEPESSLETSLVRHSSQAHANPISMATRKEGGAVEKSSASVDSRQNSSASFASQNSVEGYVDTIVDDQYVVIEASPSGSSQSSQPISATHSPCSPTQSKIRSLRLHNTLKPSGPPPGNDNHGIPIVNRQFLDSLMSSLIINTDDSRCLFALGILYAMLQNKGIHHKLLEAFSLRPNPKADENEGSPQYNSELVAILLSILDSCTSAGNSIRLVTLRLAIMLLTKLLTGKEMGEEGGKKASTEATPSTEECVGAEGATGGGIDRKVMLQDHHIALVENIYESSILRLRLFYKGPQDEVFLDMFEDEYEKEKSFKLKISYMMMDETMLLPPTNTPLTGIDFTRRLPCGDHEKARKAMRVFFAMRRLSQQMSGKVEEILPLTAAKNSAKTGDVVDMSNCDLVSCKMVVSEKTTQHFMVFNETEFLLVDPDKSKLGWGVVHFIAFLQDIDISGDPANTNSLFVVVHNRNSTQQRPKLSGKFVFEDHIRCSAAKSVFQRARDHLHHSKMTRIAKMLHLPIPDSPTAIPVAAKQEDLLDSATPATLTGATPMILVPGTSHGGAFSPTPHVTSSVLKEVFRAPSPANTSAQSQTIELSSLSPIHPVGPPLGLGSEGVNTGAPVRLTLPAPVLHIAPDVRLSDGRTSRDMSMTPEPHSRSSTVDPEEALTANGGLFNSYQADLLSLNETLEARMSDLSSEGGLTGEPEAVCPLGEPFAVSEATVIGRLDATGESVVAVQNLPPNERTSSVQKMEGDLSEHAPEGVAGLNSQENVSGVLGMGPEDVPPAVSNDTREQEVHAQEDEHVFETDSPGTTEHTEAMVNQNLLPPPVEALATSIDLDHQLDCNGSESSTSVTEHLSTEDSEQNTGHLENVNSPVMPRDITQVANSKFSAPGTTSDQSGRMESAQNLFVTAETGERRTPPSAGTLGGLSTETGPVL